MKRMVLRSGARVLLLSATLTELAACSDQALVAPNRSIAEQAHFAAVPEADAIGVSATLRRVTARYHNLNAALDDGFVLLHPCEARDEGTVGTVYVSFARVLDGQIDPESPDALIYEPHKDGLKLVGVEFAVLDTGQPPPQLVGATFQSEAEFGVFALHAWVWRDNPNGLFAETNPRVSCGA